MKNLICLFSFLLIVSISFASSGEDGSIYDSKTKAKFVKQLVENGFNTQKLDIRGTSAPTCWDYKVRFYFVTVPIPPEDCSFDCVAYKESSNSYIFSQLTQTNSPLVIYVGHLKAYEDLIVAVTEFSGEDCEPGTEIWIEVYRAPKNTTSWVLATHRIISVTCSMVPWSQRIETPACP